MSIQESAAAAQVAINKGEDALRKLKDVEELIGECRAIVSELGETETLKDWMMMLNQSHSTVIIAKDTMPLATEYGHRFIQRLFA